jgi:hypothetical protein
VFGFGLALAKTVEFLQRTPFEKNNKETDFFVWFQPILTCLVLVVLSSKVRQVR